MRKPVAERKSRRNLSVFSSAKQRVARNTAYHRRLICEPLEDRRMLSVFMVENLADGTVTAANEQPGTLRQAIFDANANPGDDTIEFASSLSGGTIALSAGELALTDTTGVTTITGLGASQLTIDANHASRVFAVDSGTTAVIFGLTIANGYSNNDAVGGPYGGGIMNCGTLTVADSTLSGNSADYGGGIYNEHILTISNCALSGNSVSYYGGCVYNPYGAVTVTGATISGNWSTSGYGGGIFNGGTFTVNSSTLSGNWNVYAYGGGIINYGTLTVTDSTLSGNWSPSEGGGICNFGAVTVSDSTIAGNWSTYGNGGGIHNHDIGTVTLSNTIVAGNMGSGAPSDILGTVSANYSLIGNYDGIVDGDGNILILNEDPLLGTLGYYGGPTQTIPLLPGSPAIDAGDNSLIASGVGTDQRGFVRVVDGDGDSVAQVDMGAFEYLSFLDVTPPTVTLTAPMSTSDRTPSISVTAIDVGSGVPNGTTVYLDCDLNGDALFTAAGETGYTTATLTSGAATFDITPALGKGTYGLRARVFDGACNEGVSNLATLQIAGPMVVTTTADIVDPTDGLMSLREAIAYASSDPGDDTITFDSSLSGGTITLAAGQLELTDTTGAITITGPGADELTIDGNHASGVFMIHSNVTAHISGLTITNGEGGGISNVGTLTVTGCAITGNANSAYGGGIYNNGILTVTDSTLSGNSTANGGGGIYNEYGTLTVVRSTLSGNSAPTFTGGGIYNYQGTTTIIDSTLANNTCLYLGGGIANQNVLTIFNSTIADNSAGSEGGGIWSNTTVTLNNSIVAGNTRGSYSWDISGGVIANSSLIGDSSGTIVGGDGNSILGKDPLLGTLGDYGGPTQTIPLLPGSPAIDAGSNVLAVNPDSSPLATDQRGNPRISNGTVDIGAYEYLNPLTVTTTLDVVDPNDGLTSLREAIAYANSDPGDDTITFDPSLAGQTITLSSGQLELSDTTGRTTITGLGANQLTIDGNHASRVFYVDSGVTADLSRLTVASGFAGEYDSGGGIYNAGALAVADSILSGNWGYEGGGICNAGTLTITGSTLSGNSASYGGGIENDGNLAVTECAFSENSGREGGAIATYGEGDLTIANSIFSNNAAGNTGGAGVICGHGKRTITGSTFTGNSAQNMGGGICNLTSELAIADSTLSGNSAAYGGGISNESALTLTDCTLSGNSAEAYADDTGGGFGGGIANYGSLTIIGNTLSGNSAEDGGGIYQHGSYGVLVLDNSIVAGNTAGDSYPDMSGPVFAYSSLIGNSSGMMIVGGDGKNILDEDPLLGTLGDYGGPTQTIPLLPGSPAIDAGDNADPPATDQRGYQRIVNSHIDMGAVEYGAVLDEPPTVDLTNTVTVLPENTDTTTRIKIADIVVTDDAVGTNMLSLSGKDAGVFEIDGDVLYLKAGASLDHEMHRQLDVTVEVNDATVGATPDDTAVHSITVSDVNEAPVATGDSYDVDEDTLLTVPAPGVLSNDTDVDGDALTAVLVAGPSRGELTLNPDGSFSYTPAANYNGSDSFTYMANDGTLDSNVATVSLTIHPVNDLPSILAITTPSGTKSGAVAFTFTLSDPESDLCNIDTKFSPDGGNTWYDASNAKGQGDGKTGLASSPSGAPHVFVWPSRVDMPNVYSSVVKLKIRPRDTGGAGDWVTTKEFTVSNHATQAPTIESVAVAEAAAPRNGKLETNEKLKMTWAATGSRPIVRQTVTVDDKPVASSSAKQIGGPYGGKYYSANIGAWTAGVHRYKITATDSKGGSFTCYGTFTVVAVGPSIVDPRVLPTNSSVAINWKIYAPGGVGSYGLTIDGNPVAVTPPSAPGVGYTGTASSLADGTHNYVITVTDKAGKTATYANTFTLPTTSAARRAVFSNTSQSGSAASAKVDWLCDLDGLLES
jgi:CSLREA domain-containing protein